MRHVTEADTTKDERHGPCQRCGWPQPLTRVRGRSGFASMMHAAGGIGIGCRWLCEECLATDRIGQLADGRPIHGVIAERRVKRSTDAASVA